MVDPDMTQAAQINVMMSAAFRAAYLELVPPFERATKHKVVTTEAHWGDMMTRLKAGDVVDLVIMSGGSIDALIKDGKIAEGSRTDLASSGIGVAVRPGAPKPDISSAGALKRALLLANSIACSTGPSGRHMADLFGRMGIADALIPKLRTVKREGMDAVFARDEADIGFHQISELLPYAGIDFVGPLPADIQHVTVFSAGLHARAKEPKHATTLVEFLTAPAAAAVIRKAGMEPR
jgi:molybdate transport system substrate-binding protein